LDWGMAEDDDDDDPAANDAPVLATVVGATAGLLAVEAHDLMVDAPKATQPAADMPLAEEPDEHVQMTDVPPGAVEAHDVMLDAPTATRPAVGVPLPEESDKHVHMTDVPPGAVEAQDLMVDAPTATRPAADMPLPEESDKQVHMTDVPPGYDLAIDVPEADAPASAASASDGSTAHVREADVPEPYDFAVEMNESDESVDNLIASHDVTVDVPHVPVATVYGSGADLLTKAVPDMPAADEVDAGVAAADVPKADEPAADVPAAQLSKLLMAGGDPDSLAKLNAALETATDADMAGMINNLDIDIRHKLAKACSLTCGDTTQEMDATRGASAPRETAPRDTDTNACLTGLTLNVQTFGGEVTKMEVNGSAPLQKLPSFIEVELGLPACVQKLVHHGKVLDLQTEATMEQAGLREGDTVVVEQGESNYRGTWQYQDDTASSGTGTQFVFLKSEGTEEHQVYAMSHGIRTATQLVCAIDGQQIVIEEQGPTQSQRYEGHLSNDGLAIQGQRTTTSAGQGLGEGSSGSFTLKRVVAV